MKNFQEGMNDSPNLNQYSYNLEKIKIKSCIHQIKTIKSTIPLKPNIKKKIDVNKKCV